MSTVRVLPIDYRPLEIDQWNDTGELIDYFVVSMSAISQESIEYEILPLITIDNFPVLENGDKYTVEAYKKMRAGEQPTIKCNGQDAGINYNYLIKKFSLDVDAGVKFDEVWLFGGGWFGYCESIMIGEDAYCVNAPPKKMDCKKFIIMGFNWERGPKEMLHSFGHRCEDMLAMYYHCFPTLRWCYSDEKRIDPGDIKDSNIYFEQFLKSVGTVHKKPGGVLYGQDEFKWLMKFDIGWWNIVEKA